jgi:hypothetical protein
VGGDVEPLREQEHSGHTIQGRSQVAVAEIGDDLIDALGKNGVRIAGEGPYPSRLGRKECFDELRTDIAGGCSDQNHEFWSFAWDCLSRRAWDWVPPRMPERRCLRRELWSPVVSRWRDLKLVGHRTRALLSEVGNRVSETALIGSSQVIAA